MKHWRWCDEASRIFGEDSGEPELHIAADYAVPHRIRLTAPAGKKAVGLISGETYPAEFIRPPDHPLLLEFR